MTNEKNLESQRMMTTLENIKFGKLRLKNEIKNK
jgi:hypothetical protein